MIIIPTIIKTEHLSKIYNGKVKAVEDLNIEIEKGEVYGFLGPNGAGKTTTINMLTTRIAPTSGTAVVAGHDIRKEAFQIRRIMGVVPQDLTTDEDLSGYENLLMISEFYDMKRSVANEQITKLLELVDLTEASRRLVRTYSGGMRKRLELIAGLVQEPEILFLDEPTLGLDVQTRAQMWNYVKEIQGRLGITVILTSHYLEEVDTLSDRVSIIDHGKVLVTDTPQNLKSSLKGDSITLSFATQDEVETMKGFPGAVSSKETKDKSLRIVVEDSDSALPKIVKFMTENNLTATRMTITKPTLDEVFMEYTGKYIRDDETGDARKMMMNVRRLRR